MNKPKSPLYRKHNKLAANFQLQSKNGKFRDERNSKLIKSFEGNFKSIGETREGYDYTPLFKFLLSKIGQEWDTVFSEAVCRLDKQYPVFWLVDLNFQEGQNGITRIGESTYYSTLTVKEGILVKANENALAPEKQCTCCTHSFNGIPF